MMFISLPLSMLFSFPRNIFLALTFLSLTYANHQFKFSFFGSCFLTSTKVCFEHFIGEFMQPYDQVSTPCKITCPVLWFLFTCSLLLSSSTQSEHSVQGVRGKQEWEKEGKQEVKKGGRGGLDQPNKINNKYQKNNQSKREK